MEDHKKCCPIGFGFALGIWWALAVGVIGVLNRYRPGFGGEFLRVFSSIYPKYHAGSGLRNLAIGVAWAFANGLVGGILLVLIGKVFSGRKSCQS